MCFQIFFQLTRLLFVLTGGIWHGRLHVGHTNHGARRLGWTSAEYIRITRPLPVGKPGGTGCYLVRNEWQIDVDPQSRRCVNIYCGTEPTISGYSDTEWDSHGQCQYNGSIWWSTTQLIYMRTSVAADDECQFTQLLLNLNGTGCCHANSRFLVLSN